MRPIKEELEEDDPQFGTATHFHNPPHQGTTHSNIKGKDTYGQHIADISALDEIKIQTENINQKIPDQVNSSKGIVYPTLNIVATPRVFQQKVQNARVALTKYKERIYANNRRKSYESPLVDTSSLTKFTPEDGMIYNMRDIKKKTSNRGIGSIKILICVCMYNESRNAINLTLQGIYDNLPYFQERGYSQGDIAVVLIQDGILKLVDNRDKRTFAKGKQSMVEFYAQMDRQEGKPKCDLKQRINVILDEIDNYKRRGMSQFVARNSDFPPSIQKNVSLLYQNLWQPSKTKVDIRGNPDRSGVDGQSKKLRVFSCFKHINGTKLSSHLWFFQGFCRYIQPKFCALLDVGTKPDSTGLVNLIQGFQWDKNIGGVTGFMSVDSNFKSEQGGDDKQSKKNCLEANFFSIQKAQEYQYIISHFLDKNSQSALGFLHVLPGAWSAYRYKALIKSDKYEPNLLQRSYFKMILNPNLSQKDYRQANMYLAQDRILSLGIYCQMDCQYTLKYIPDAIAYTDPMKTHKDLMTQRRRWINSSLFAFLYVFRNYYFNVMDSNHNFFRKYITLNISMYIALFSFINTYVTPSIYFFVLYATVLQLGGYGSAWQHLAKTISFIYAMCFIASVGGGFTGRAWTDKAQLISYVLSGFTFVLLLLVFINVIFIYLRLDSGKLDINNFVIISLIIMLFINLGFSSFIIVMHLFTHPQFVGKLIVDSASYMSFQGAYAQVMVAHSFCNVDDVSWGTKGSTTAHGQKKYQTQKVFFVSSWLFYNCLLTAIFLYVDVIVPARTSTGGGGVLIGIAIYGSVYLTIKSTLAIYYHFKWVILQKCCKSKQLDLTRKQKIDNYWKNHFQYWLKKQSESQRS